MSRYQKSFSINTKGPLIYRCERAEPELLMKVISTVIWGFWRPHYFTGSSLYVMMIRGILKNAPFE